MTNVIHVDFRAHTAARRVPNPEGKIAGPYADATFRFWRAVRFAIDAYRTRRRDRPAIQTLWDAHDYPASERLRCVAGCTLVTLREATRVTSWPRATS